MDVMEAILTRRSIRKFKPESIPQDSIIRILEGARWAPSWKNSQCPRMVVITDRKIKEEVGRTLPGNRAFGGVQSAPVLIAVCAKMGESGYGANGPATEKGDWYMFDCGLAVENMLLSAWSLGLGSVVIGYFDAPTVGHIIELPEGFALVNLIAIGVPDENPEAPPRKALEQVSYLNKFGGKLEG